MKISDKTRAVGMPKLGILTRHWEVRAGFLWLRKDTISVHAWQVENQDSAAVRSAIAVARISRNTLPLHEVVISNALAYGDEALALQVYAISQKPGWQHPEYREILQRFAFELGSNIFDPKSYIVIWTGDTPSYERLPPEA